MWLIVHFKSGNSKLISNWKFHSTKRLFRKCPAFVSICLFLFQNPKSDTSDDDDAVETDRRWCWIFELFFVGGPPSHALNIRFESPYKAQISIRSESTFTHVQSVLACVCHLGTTFHRVHVCVCVFGHVAHTQSEPIIWKLPNEWTGAITTLEMPQN